MGDEEAELDVAPESRPGEALDSPSVACAFRASNHRPDPPAMASTRTATTAQISALPLRLPELEMKSVSGATSGTEGGIRTEACAAVRAVHRISRASDSLMRPIVQRLTAPARMTRPLGLDQRLTCRAERRPCPSAGVCGIAGSRSCHPLTRRVLTERLYRCAPLSWMPSEPSRRFGRWPSSPLRWAGSWSG